MSEVESFIKWSHGVQRAAQPILTDAAWAYYSGAAEEESSHKNNLTSYSRYEFRPRWFVSAPSSPSLHSS